MILAGAQIARRLAIWVAEADLELVPSFYDLTSHFFLLWKLCLLKTFNTDRVSKVWLLIVESHFWCKDILVACFHTGLRLSWAIISAHQNLSLNRSSAALKRLIIMLRL
jgi:hypothetical protein